MFDKETRLALFLICFPLAVMASTPDYDANDFASEVISYVEGDGVYDLYDPCYGFYIDPYTALGRPTLNTTGDQFTGFGLVIPVLPVYPAWRANEVVTIGEGGELILKFNHPVENDKNNPFGMDLIVFGNSKMNTTDSSFWMPDSDPETKFMSGSIFQEPAIVSVSQDGIIWFTYDDVNDSGADTFAPTASYEYDDVNDVWSDELNPTKPVDPNLTSGDLAGYSLVEMIEAYEGSAGGTGFDIGVFGLDWILYVKIEHDETEVGLADIDAAADVTACGDWRHPYPEGDINEDCRVDFGDVKLLCQYWLVAISSPEDDANIADLHEDDFIDLYDLAFIADRWCQCSWECD